MARHLSRSSRLNLVIVSAFLAAMSATAARTYSVTPAHAGGTCDVSLSSMSPDSEELGLLVSANAYRAVSGLPELRLSYALTRSAQWKSANMAARGPVAHDDGFRSWEQRFSDCGYSVPYMSEGENLAGGNANATATLQQWKASPEHNANLLNPSYTAVGIKRVKSSDSNDRYTWYWTMELGSDLDLDLSAGLAAPLSVNYADAAGQ